MDNQDWEKRNKEVIRDFDFLKSTKGAYCKRENASGEILQYAYISIDVSTLVTYNVEGQTMEVFDWDNNENQSHDVIAKFLSELTFRPWYMGGNEAEQKYAMEFWQFCLSQNVVPQCLKDYVNKNVLEN